MFQLGPVQMVDELARHYRITTVRETVFFHQPWQLVIDRDSGLAREAVSLWGVFQPDPAKQ